jgi:hypothetical protein
MAAMNAAKAEPDNFITLRALARACINTGDHHTARQYVEKALQAVPLAPPAPDERLFYGLARLCIRIIRLLPRYRKRISPDAGSDLFVRRHVHEWIEWARAYLAWYDATFGPGSPSSVH